jgi:hypothetical protein
MDADGTNQVRLTFNDLTETRPAWSPDGTKIVYARDEQSQAGDIHTMNLDGSGDANITNTPSVAEGAPDWQPLLGPQRSDYKNAAQFCKALRGFLGDEAFRNRYGGGANAHGKCVNANRG